MKYLYTKSEHYRLFIDLNNTDRLYKGIKILPSESKFSNLFKKALNLNEEIFNNPIKTEYQLSEHTNSGKKIIFKTKSNNEYRLDILLIKENGVFINHISFTLNDPVFDIIPDNEKDWEAFNNEYDKQTNRGETIEILDRIHFILEDIVNKNILDNYFCIGGTEIQRKNKIYEYFLKVVVGDGGFEKINTNVYPIGWGLYFRI